LIGFGFRGGLGTLKIDFQWLLSPQKKSLKISGIPPSSYQKFKARKQANLLLEMLNKKPINNSRTNSNKYFKSNFLLINAGSNTKHFLEFPFEFSCLDTCLSFPHEAEVFVI
jgi:hypothetical protein